MKNENQMTRQNWERAHLIDKVFIREAEYLSEEYYYEQERNKRLPAIVEVVIPEFKPKDKNEIRHN